MARRAGRSWAPAVAGALAVHAAMVLAVVLTVEIASPPKELPAVIVQLLRMAPAPATTKRRRPFREVTPLVTPSPSPAALVVPTTSANAPAEAEPAAGTTATADVQAKLRGILRGSVGCADAKLYRLSPEEEAKCHRFLQAHVDPDLQIPAPIDPLKRSWYDATIRARQVARVMQPGHSHPSLVAGKCGGAAGSVGIVKVGPCGIRLSTMFDDDDAPFPGR
ncbi:MAG TPA: hypothetical protein VIJ94_18955 [Caulobacteraceae bacterium]